MKKNNSDFTYRISTINGIEYYVCSTRTIKGKNKRLYAKSLSDLEDKYKAWEEENKGNIIIPKTIGELIIVFSNQLLMGSHNIDYQNFTKWFLSLDFSNTLLTDISYSTVSDFVKGLSDIFNKIHKTKIYNYIVSALDYGDKEGYCESFTGDFIDIDSSPRKVEYLDMEQTSLLLDECQRKGNNGDIRYGISAYAISFMLYTGTNSREVIALKWSDIEDGYINVRNIRERIYKGKNKPASFEDTPATKPRKIKLNRDSNSILWQLKVLRKFNYNQDDYILLTSNGKPLDRLLIENTLENIVANTYLSDGITFQTVANTYYIRNNILLSADGTNETVINLNTLSDEKKFKIMKILTES